MAHLDVLCRASQLTGDAATWLCDNGAVVVGIDYLDIDSIDGGERPVHSILLRAGIPIIEHMSNLGRASR